ncbi:hypothetical protein SHKM778_65830 [Streptomyces sp. KM77-8]|uniref:Uncharacterized protein n=1 Tax=Streptomyces haneummycinicus TaxID=3074435 RepID=A0AAT9HRS6_9ACTN
MIDVGLFAPIVRGILRFCRADPMRIVVGTALLAAIVSLDGDGSTTFMITRWAEPAAAGRAGAGWVWKVGVRFSPEGADCVRSLPPGATFR